jgi:hypothetical protein
MRSFINNVAAEISRMAAFALSSTKSDFIGSVSLSILPSELTGEYYSRQGEFALVAALSRNTVADNGIDKSRTSLSSSRCACCLRVLVRNDIDKLSKEPDRNAGLMW